MTCVSKLAYLASLRHLINIVVIVKNIDYSVICVLLCYFNAQTSCVNVENAQNIINLDKP